MLGFGILFLSTPSPFFGSKLRCTCSVGVLDLLLFLFRWSWTLLRKLSFDNDIAFWEIKEGAIIRFPGYVIATQNHRIRTM